MKKVALPLFIVVFTLHTMSHAQQDTAAYRAASSIQHSTEKIHALEEFVKQYPATKFKTRAYDALFDLYVERGNEAGAVNSAGKSLETLTPENRMSPYNRFAYALAQKNIGLDSALVWIIRAVEIAEESNSRSLSGFQDSKAYVLYRKGKFAEAEQLQRIAIKGHEDDSEYLSHLALFEKENGKLHDALKTMSKALYVGGDQESKEYFLDWIAQAEKEKMKQEALKKSVVMTTVHSYIDTLKGSKLIAAKSSAAMLMADLGVDLPTARQWAEAATKTLNKNSSINDITQFKQSLSLVLAAQQKFKDALTLLRSIEDLVDPYETKYWNALGQSYERSDDVHAAISAYMQGLVPRNDKQLRTALETVYKKEHGSLDGLDKALDSLKQASTNFDPGRYNKNTTPFGKVILAELFTGAECNPCVSSDMAFDALSEYYPRSALAILEYHVHIPGPDPMTTNESWDRYNWNSGEGTPTVIIDGREKIVGGGPRTVAKNRFGVYRYAIQKFESDKPRVNLSIVVNDRHENIAVEIQVARAKAMNRVTKPVLHIALVERSVDYTGANGIANHRYVVRRMLDGASGTPLSLKETNETIDKQISISEVEKRIKEYLDNPTSQSSWSYRRPFTGWKARPEKLNRSNLAIVAWVQDMSTKEVLQAGYQDVPSTLGIK